MRRTQTGDLGEMRGIDGRGVVRASAGQAMAPSVPHRNVKVGVEAEGPLGGLENRRHRQWGMSGAVVRGEKMCAKLGIVKLWESLVVSRAPIVRSEIGTVQEIVCVQKSGWTCDLHSGPADASNQGISLLKGFRVSKLTVLNDIDVTLPL